MAAMSTDLNAPRLRERIWIEKFDHTGDVPRLIETVAVEDGRLVSVVRPEPAPLPEDEPA
jgi:hypothetical protein